MTIPGRSRAYMIDAVGTRDRDDAIMITPSGYGWTVTVWIANPTNVVTLNSPVDRQAYDRGWTRYYPGGRTTPMLGQAAERAASLTPGTTRRTLRVDFGVDSVGQVHTPRLRLEPLRGPVALPYDDVVALLREGGHPDLTALLAAASVMQRARRAAGALTWLDPTTRWVVTEDGTAKPLPKTTIVQAYLIVTEMMVAANTVIAGWAAARDIPILYRNQRAGVATPAREQILDDVATHAATGSWAGLADRLAVMLRRATYDATVAGHWALNLPAYTHATSPLRRYADLVTIRQVGAAVTGQPLPYSADEVQRIGDTLTKRAAEAAAARAERNAEKNRKAKRDLVAAAAGVDTAAARAAFAAADDTALFRLLKTAVRDGALGTVPAFVDETVARFDDDRFGAREAHLVLFTRPGGGGAEQDDGTRRVHDAALAALTRNPALAVSALDMERTLNGWPQPVRDIVTTGPPHAPVFAVTARLDTPDGSVTGATRRGTVKKDAAARADLSLLCALAGVSDVSSDASLDAQVLDGDVLAPVRFNLDAAGRNPVSVVNEWAQAHRRPTPVFTVTRTGPPHTPTFTATVTVTVTGTDVTGTGTGPTKQVARTEAAAALLTALQARA